VKYLLWCLLTPALIGQSDVGLVGHWPFENDFLDFTPAAHHGRPLRGATFTDGRVGRALSLNGKAAFVVIPDRAPLRLGKHDFTVSFWLRLPADPEPGDVGVMGKGAGTAGGWSIVLMDQGKRLVYADSRAELSVPLPDDGAWHYTTLRRKGGELVWLLDGRRETSMTAAVADLDSTERLFLGKTAGDANARISLDELRIYDRALYPREITALVSQNVPQRRHLPPRRPPERAPVIDSEAVPERREEKEAPPGIEVVPAVPFDEPDRAPTIEGIFFLHGTEEVPSSPPAVRADGTVYRAVRGERDLVIERLDARGRQPILRTGGTAIDRVVAVARAGSGLAFTGWIGSDLELGGEALGHTGDDDVVIAVLDGALEVAWSRRIGGPGRDRGQAITVDDNGRIIVAGSYSSGFDIEGRMLFGDGIFFACYTASGELAWVYPMRALGSPRIATIAVGDRGVLVLGGAVDGAVTLGNRSLPTTKGFLMGLRLPR